MSKGTDMTVEQFLHREDQQFWAESRASPGTCSEVPPSLGRTQRCWEMVNQGPYVLPQQCHGLYKVVSWRSPIFKACLLYQSLIHDFHREMSKALWSPKAASWISSEQLTFTPFWPACSENIFLIRHCDSKRKSILDVFPNNSFLSFEATPSPGWPTAQNQKCRQADLVAEINLKPDARFLPTFLSILQ